MTLSTGRVELLADLRERVWAIRASAIQSMLATLEARRLPSPVPIPPSAVRNGIAVLPLHGPISRRADLFTLLFGGTTTERFSAMLRDALADRTVERILIDVDSPGGDAAGITELAAEIYDARFRKPVTAFVDTTAASAAYWLASQASEVVVAPSGEVGSIGVFALHIDRSRALDAVGLTPTFIQAGKFKTEENPLQPLSDEARAAIQERVDAAFDMFVRDVARGRGVPTGTVRSDFGEGRMVLAKDAVRRGMADRVSASIEFTTPALTGARGTALGAEHVYLEVQEKEVAFSYVLAARDALRAGLREHVMPEPRLRFFRPEQAEDSAGDGRERVGSAIAIDGCSYPDRHPAEIWVSAELSSHAHVASVVAHEVRHLWWGEDEDFIEGNAEDYAQRLVRRLHGDGASRERGVSVDDLYGAPRG